MWIFVSLGRDNSLFHVLSQGGLQVVWSVAVTQDLGGRGTTGVSSHHGQQHTDPQVPDEGLARAHSSRLGSPRKHPVALAHCRPNWSPRPTELSKTLREPLNHPKTQLSKHSRHNGSVYT